MAAVEITSDKQIIAAKATARIQSKLLADGLYLKIDPLPKTRKWFAIRFQKADGKSTTKAIGTFDPARHDHMSLAAAKLKAGELRAQLKRGEFPENTKTKKVEIYNEIAITTFEQVAREFIAFHAKRCASDYDTYSLRRLEQHVFPYVGDKDISNLTVADFLSIFRRMEEKKIYDMSRRVRQLVNQTMDYAIVTEKAKINPIPSLRNALIKVPHEPLPCIPMAEFPKLLRDIEDYSGERTTQLALKFVCHVPLRTKELRSLRWAWINFDTRLITIMRNTMKRKEVAFQVPISRQVLAILEELKTINGDSEFVFASTLGFKPVSGDILLNPLSRMGYKGIMCGHGFRSLFSTILYEHASLGFHKFDGLTIENALIHLDKNMVRDAYLRSTLVAARIGLMQYWSDHLDRISGATAA